MIKFRRRGRSAARIIAAAAVVVCIAVFVFPIVSGASYRKGDTGQMVSEIQTRLKNWGYYTGEVDGIFGSETDKAVRYFQKRNGLTVDGIVGRQTLAALGIRDTANSGSSSYSSEIQLLARTIAAEGRGESYLGQVAIGAVIMNRVEHPSFPNTISGVIYQSGAFEAVLNGHIWETPVPAECTRAAVEAYNGYDPTYGCLYYYNPAKTSNKWMTSKPVYMVIGSHYFCK
ncbi:MAG: spore cortex-lytic enzyme [Oscillospiraceae bacterium]|nr:spore cortex-lytic enzyme [Oscillospiraceae bacterium]